MTRKNRAVLHYIKSKDDWAGYKSNFIGSDYMFGDGSQPPVFLKNRGTNQNVSMLSRLTFDANGNGKISTVTIPQSKFLGLYRSSQAAVMVGNTVHIAGMSYEDETGREDYNVANYYMRYNLDTNAFDLKFMGWTGSASQATVDEHNEPALLIDSLGYLHYFSGAHNHQIWHRKSLLPVTDSNWNNVWGANVTADDKFSPGPNKSVARYSSDSVPQLGVDYVGSLTKAYTYVHPRIDSQNIIHLIMRESLSKGYKLIYIRGIPKGNGDYLWTDEGALVHPSWYQYSTYTQKIHQDNKDNIYAIYGYSIQNFKDNTWFNQKTKAIKSTQADCAALTTADDCINVKDDHLKRWADEALAGSSNRYEQPYQHDTVIIGSVNFGKTWALTTTEEFLNRATKSPLSALAGAELTENNKLALYGFAKGGSNSYSFAWTLDGNAVGNTATTLLSSISAGQHQITLTVSDGQTTATHTISVLVLATPTLTTTPGTTTSDTTAVEVNGTVGTKVWVNGVPVATIDATGKVTVNLDTSGGNGTKSFAIRLKDSNNNTSPTLNLTIERVS